MIIDICQKQNGFFNFSNFQIFFHSYIQLLLTTRKSLKKRNFFWIVTDKFGSIVRLRFAAFVCFVRSMNLIDKSNNGKKKKSMSKTKKKDQSINQTIEEREEKIKLGKKHCPNVQHEINLIRFFWLFPNYKMNLASGIYFGCLAYRKKNEIKFQHTTNKQTTQTQDNFTVHSFIHSSHTRIK